MHVLHLERNVPEARPIRRRGRVRSAGSRREEARHLEHVAAVGSASHHDLHRHALETNDPIDPLAAEYRGLAAVEPERARNWTVSSRSSTTSPMWTKSVTGAMAFQ
jgi:hypothetical protein